MKKWMFAGIVVAAVFAVLATAWGSVSAQAPTPQVPNQAPGYGMRGGRMGGGMMGQYQTVNGEGIMHDTMLKVFAEKLGVSVTDLEARLNKGESMYTIATEKGLSFDEFRALMTDARTQAIDKAVADGTLTKEQGDWMKARGQRMNGQGFAPGACGGMMGGGRGGRWQQPATAPQS